MTKVLIVVHQPPPAIEDCSYLLQETGFMLGFLVIVIQDLTLGTGELGGLLLGTGMGAV